MISTALGLAILPLLGISTLWQAAGTQVRITIDHNDGAEATSAFNFKNVPSPVSDDFGSKAILELLVGEIDPGGADLASLVDGQLPSHEDQPARNFFFDSGSFGGRFRLDLGVVVDIGQVNSYSWHPNTRGPQVYLLYGSAGVDPTFKISPNPGTDPTRLGWKLIAIVDTRPKQGVGGGQYAVSVSGSNGSLGRYRFLLFDCVATETHDNWGNTFYSEIDVVAAK